MAVERAASYARLGYARVAVGLQLNSKRVEVTRERELARACLHDSRGESVGNVGITLRIVNSRFPSLTLPPNLEFAVISYRDTLILPYWSIL